MRFILLTLALMLPTLAVAAPTTFQGKLKWTSEAPVEKIIGTAEGTAALEVNLAELASLRGTLTVSVASMMSGNEKRDGHLRSADWLDAAQFPNITFVIESVKVLSSKPGKVTASELEISGQFTLHGVTTPLTLKATLKSKGDKVKLKTTFEIKLDAYKIAGRAGIVGKKVGTTIQIEASFKGKVGS